MMQNPYLDEFAQINDDLSDCLLKRRELVLKYAWAVPDDTALDLVSRHASRVTEIGAGNGYWAYLLDQMHIDVEAYDLAPHENNWVDGKWFDVRYADGYTFRAPKESALFLCWPPMSDMAYHALGHYYGDTLLYIGEWSGGCTADKHFFKVLERRWERVAWHVLPRCFGINDALYVFKR